MKKLQSGLLTKDDLFLFLDYDSVTNRGGVSALNGIYKLAENSDDSGKMVPSMKFTSSEEKAHTYDKAICRQ